MSALAPSRRTNVVVLIVVASIAVLNVAVTVVVAATVEPLAGLTAVTVGAVVLPLVNDHVRLAASALPATSFTRGSVAPPLTVAVYVPAASGLLGVSVAVRAAAL